MRDGGVPLLRPPPQPPRLEPAQAGRLLGPLSYSFALRPPSSPDLPFQKVPDLDARSPPLPDSSRHGQRKNRSHRFQARFDRVIRRPLRGRDACLAIPFICLVPPNFLYPNATASQGGECCYVTESNEAMARPLKRGAQPRRCFHACRGAGRTRGPRQRTDPKSAEQSVSG